MPTRRTVLVGALATMGLGALAACGGGNGGSGGNASTGTAKPKQVIIVTDSDPDSLNPGLTTGYQALDVNVKVYEGLVWLDKEGKPQPQLATKWETSADNLTYTFTLRENVKWHDGSAFTADDVKYSFETLLKDNARAQGVISKIASITIKDPKTIEFKLKSPYAPFLIQMKVFDTPILCKAVYEGKGDVKSNPANRAPVGTGPFKFGEWKAGQSITLEKNTAYWAQGQPKVDSLLFRIITEPQNRVNAIVAGEVDILPAVMLPQANIKDIEGKPNVNVNKQTAIPALYFMQMNQANVALAKPEIRKAIAAAVDRPRIVTQAMGGLAKPGVGAWGEGFPWAVNKDSSYDKLYKLDPAKAKTDVAAAGGVAGGLRLTYDAARPQFVAAAQIIKDNLSQIGIEVKLEPLENSVFRDKVYAKRDFDMSLQSFSSSGDPAIGYHRLYLTNTGRTVNVNPTGFANAEVDKLLTDAAAKPDQAERGKFYQQAQAIIDAAVPTLILFDELQADVNRTNITGLYVGVNPSDQFGQVDVK
ncbi:MAG TPA: ABC transporter substrate-binding protein [Propionibacteriaceae bacterium]|nr:ABC transporter substrate-binding protein [Propionibacteriaceae bacterium]HPZ49114.1 ABC transporter substrate-binding protein [Propionibacteriaceae bacterium]